MRGLDWGWGKAQRALRAHKCSVPSNWRPLPYMGCHSSTEVGGWERQACAQEAGSAQTALLQTGWLPP